MDKKGMSTAALVAAAFAIFVGVWGLVTHNSAADSEGALTSAFMWVALAIVITGVALVLTLLSQRR